MNYSYIQNGNNINLDSQLNTQPLIFTNQIYPKMPWYPKVGSPCGNGCGATSMCSKNGLCVRRPSTGTVFGPEVHYKFKKSPLPTIKEKIFRWF